MSDIRNELLVYLREKSNEFVPTSLLVEETGKTRSEVNRALYSLYSSKFLEKKAEENGSKPQWRYSNLRDRILELLDPVEGKSPQAVAAALGMSKGEVNPYLYALKKDDLVKLVTEDLGRKPQWTRL